MPVRCVAFDADDTLWDFTTAMHRGLGLAIDAARSMGPDVTAQLSVDDLIARFDALYAVHVADPRPGRPIASLRPASFEQALADLGVEDAALVDQMSAVYFDHRHGSLPLFAEIADVLDPVGLLHLDPHEARAHQAQHQAGPQQDSPHSPPPRCRVPSREARPPPAAGSSRGPTLEAPGRHRVPPPGPLREPVGKPDAAHVLMACRNPNELFASGILSEPVPGAHSARPLAKGAA